MSKGLNPAGMERAVVLLRDHTVTLGGNREIAVRAAKWIAGVGFFGLLAWCASGNASLLMWRDLPMFLAAGMICRSIFFRIAK